MWDSFFDVNWKSLIIGVGEMKKNVLWNTVGTIFYFFCQWILTVIVVNMTNHDYEIAGYLALAMTTSSSYSTIALFNMRSFQVSDVAGEFQDGTYAGSRVITCAVSFICCVIAAVVSGNSRYQILCILAYMGIRLVEAWVDVLQGMDQKYERYDIIGKSYLIRGFLTVGLFVVGIRFFNSLIVALLLVFLSTAFVVIYYDGSLMKKINATFSVEMKKDVWILLKKCFPFVIISYLLSQENLLPKQMLQNLFGAEQQGIYSTIAAPALIVQVCAAVVFSPFLPVFSKAYHEKNFDEFRNMLRKLYFVLIGMSVVVTLGAKLLGKWGLSLLYGKDILQNYNIFIPIVWVTILTAITWIFVAIMTAMRKIKTLLVGMLIDFGICLLLMKPCIMTFEKNGVNLVQIISLFLFIVYMIIICEIAVKQKKY